MAPSQAAALVARRISHGSRTGAIVGTIVGLIVLLLLCLPFLLRARRERRRQQMGPGYPVPMGMAGPPMAGPPMTGPPRSLGPMQGPVQGPMPAGQPPYHQQPYGHPHGMPSPPPNPDDSNSFEDGKIMQSQMPPGAVMSPYPNAPPNGNPQYQYPSPPPTTVASPGSPTDTQTRSRSALPPGGTMINTSVAAPFNPDQPGPNYMPSPPPTLPHTDTMRTRSSVRSSGASSVSAAIEGISSFFRTGTLTRSSTGTRGAMDGNTRSPVEMGYPQYDANGNQMWMMADSQIHPGYAPVRYEHPMQTIAAMQNMQPGQPGQVAHPEAPVSDAHLVDPTFTDGQYLTGASAEYYSGGPLSPPMEEPGLSTQAAPESSVPTPPADDDGINDGSSLPVKSTEASRGIMQQPKLVTSRTDSLKTALTGTDFSPISPTSPPRVLPSFETGHNIVEEPEEDLSDEDRQSGDRTLSLSPQPVTATTSARQSLTPEPYQSPYSRLVPSPILPPPGTVNPRDVWAPGTEDELFVHKTAELDRIEHSPTPALQLENGALDSAAFDASNITPTPSEHGGDTRNHLDNHLDTDVDGRQSAMSFLSPSVVSVSSYVTASQGQLDLDGDYDDWSENDIDYGKEMMAGTIDSQVPETQHYTTAAPMTTVDYPSAGYTSTADYSAVDYTNAGLNVYPPQQQQPVQNLHNQTQHLVQQQPQLQQLHQQPYSISVSPPDPKIDEFPLIQQQYNNGQQYNGPLFWVDQNGNQMVPHPYIAAPPQQNLSSNLLATPAMTTTTIKTESPSPVAPSTPYSNYVPGTLSASRPNSSMGERTPTPQPAPIFLPVTPTGPKLASNFNSPLSVPGTGQSQGPASPLSNGGSTPGHSTASASPRIFTCDECGRVFDQIHKLNHHKRYHERPHECPVPDCGKRFGTKTHLDRHINDKHSKSRKYHCTEEGCPYSVPGGKSFPRKDNWRRHMVNKHNVHPDHDPIEVVDQPMGGF